MNPVDGRTLELEVKQMNDIITHRGPDGEGCFVDDRVALGHRRLAILDLTDAGHQPMHRKYGKNEYVIIFNGEIFNYLELKEELMNRGYSFSSHTDTEVILASYHEWGCECVEKFNGMWAFAIYDICQHVIFCSRDRFGIKPFYYCDVGDRFIFASEIKQILSASGLKAVANKKRLYDFLQYGWLDHTEETLFEGIYQLRGGHSLIYDLDSNTYEINCWYDLYRKVSTVEPMPQNEAIRTFCNLLEDSIRLRLRSDVKVGSCLSGGLDSSSIVCMANKLLHTVKKPEVQEVVSSCFHEKQYDEQEFIDEVTSKIGIISHKVFPDIKMVMNDFENVVWHQDEPFVSTSIFAQWAVFREARRRNILVMLDGQGADELLAGYHGFFSVYLIELLKSFKLRSFLRELWMIKRTHGYSYKTLFVKTVAKLIGGGAKDFFWNLYEKRYGIIKSNGMDPSLRRAYFSVRDFSLDQVVRINLPALLHYEDRNSMAHSVEARLPFLDHRLVEFVVAMPSEYKIQGGLTKVMLRECAKGILPEKVRARTDKMGFVTPEYLWILQNEEYFYNSIRDSVYLSNGFISEKMMDYFKGVVNGKIPFDFFIWRVVVFGKWIQKFNVHI